MVSTANRLLPSLASLILLGAALIASGTPARSQGNLDGDWGARVSCTANRHDPKNWPAYESNFPVMVKDGRALGRRKWDGGFEDYAGDWRDNRKVALKAEGQVAGARVSAFDTTYIAKKISADAINFSGEMLVKGRGVVRNCELVLARNGQDSVSTAEPLRPAGVDISAGAKREEPAFAYRGAESEVLCKGDGERVALLIGQQSYSGSLQPLTNPQRDTASFGRLLCDNGFSVVRHSDLDVRAFDGAIENFIALAQAARTSLVYYSGHGFAAGRRNWLVPVDARLGCEDVAADEAVSPQVARGLVDLDQQVLARLSGSGDQIVILDACRIEPVKGCRGGYSPTLVKGFNRAAGKGGRLMVYATQDGEVALDALAGSDNSPLMTAITSRLSANPKLNWVMAMLDVSEEVARLTRSRQRPNLDVSISPKGCLAPTCAADGDPGGAQSLGIPNAAPSAPVATDELAWSILKTVSDVAALRRFVDEFPTGVHVEEARARVAALERGVGGAQKRNSDNLAVGVERKDAATDMIRAHAARQGMVLPSIISLSTPEAGVPANVADYAGAWGGPQRWNGAGRHLVLIVSRVEKSGAAFGYYVEGPPSSGSRTQAPAQYIPVEGKITDQGLVLEAFRGFRNTFKILPGDQMRGDSLSMDRKGGNSTIFIERIARPGLSEVARLTRSDPGGAQSLVIPNAAPVGAIAPQAEHQAATEKMLRAHAAKQGVPLPSTISLSAPDATVPANFAEYAGTWGGAQRWDGKGRHVVLVVSRVEKSGAAFGFYAQGPPTPAAVSQNPALYVLIEGKITDQGFAFEAFRGWRHIFKVLPGGQIKGETYPVGQESRKGRISIERISGLNQASPIGRPP